MIGPPLTSLSTLLDCACFTSALGNFDTTYGSIYVQHDALFPTVTIISILTK